jgi:hypothetical protein
MLVPLTLAIAIGLFYITGAQAVHNLGVFELDSGPHTLNGTSYNGANATDEAAAGDDWDNVCYSVVGNADCGTTTPDSALASSWASDQFITTTDPFQVDGNATIFTGGGSKDPEDLSAWAWKDGAGGLPDKDNLQHAFAARYDATDEDCAAGGTTPETCNVLYYGSDRFDNSGDAQQGFWFIQNPMSTSYDHDDDPATAPVPCPQKIGGGTGFCDPATGAAVSHKNNDLLIISDFSNGGTTSSITIYTWQNGALQFEGGGPPPNSAQCGVFSLPADPFCGIVNLSNGTPAEWPFLDKSGNTTYLAGELFEAGVNLTPLDLGDVCFSTVVAETRSSTSTTATLKDFVLGGFGQCEASISSTQTWTPADSATITVTGAQTWTGTVTFSLHTSSTCTDTTPLYTSDAIAVSNNDATASTADDTTAPFPPPQSSSTTVYWKVHFDALTPSQLADTDSCVEQTQLIIDNDNTAP